MSELLALSLVQFLKVILPNNNSANKKFCGTIFPMNKGRKLANKVLLNKFQQYKQLYTMTNQVSFQRLKFVSLFENQPLHQLKQNRHSTRFNISSK
jgi:hypothetical protein